MHSSRSCAILNRPQIYASVYKAVDKKLLRTWTVCFNPSQLMKRCLACFLVAAAVAQAEDIKTVTGEEYKNVKISRAEPDGLVIIASYGIIKIPFTELSPELQQKYHYDAKTADTYRKQVDDAKALREQSIAAAQQKRAQELAAAAAVATAGPPTASATARPGPPAEAQTKTRLSEPSLHGTMLDQRPSTSTQHTGTKCFVQGHVVQVMEAKGILISTVKANAFGLPQPKDRSLVFVGGSFEPTLDYDDSIAVDATEAGTYTYVTVQGADKTVAGYDFVSIRTVLPPLDALKQR